MPAVLVIEALAQLASILAWKIAGRDAGRRHAHLLRRHRRCALPAPGAARATSWCSSPRCSGWCAAIGKFAVRAKVDGEIVAEAEPDGGDAHAGRRRRQSGG